ncbi:MAG: PVC-type heme-binding CxxCH protein [Roseibacillus sp.]
MRWKSQICSGVTALLMLVGLGFLLPDLLSQGNRPGEPGESSLSEVPLAVAGSLDSPDFEPKVTEIGTPPSPREVVEGMEGPDGFRVEVFASEPQVRVPIDMTVDDAGRVWVAESYSYMDWPVEGSRTVLDSLGRAFREVVPFASGKGHDRVVVLTDSDGDGKAEESRVAISGIKHLSSLAVGWGGVWVLDLPNLQFYPDPDGDGVIDSAPVTKLSGFTTRAKWNMPNSLTWGPDGWLYGTSGQMGWSSVRGLRWSCGVWRYHPAEDRFEVVANGMTNPWGIDWNAEGDCFVSGNCNGHLWSIHHGGYYDRGWGGAAMPVGSKRFTAIEKVPHYPPGLDWKTSWQRRFIVGTEADEFGGGHSHCGLLFYQGGSWPEEYEGRTLMANTFGRRLNVDKVSWEDGYVSERQGDLMKAGTEWFRGVSVEQDVDGNVLVSDWCDKGECHDETGVHRASGRIYRLCYGESSKREAVDLHRETDSELVKFLTHENHYYRQRASRLLMERLRRNEVAEEVLQVLVELVSEGKTWQSQLSSLHTLAGGGKLALVLEKALKAEEGRIRAAAVRLGASEEIVSEVFLSKVREMVSGEDDERVQWQLASAMRVLASQEELGLKLLTKIEGENLTRMLWQTIGGPGELGVAGLSKFYQKSRAQVGRLEALSGLIDYSASEELAKVLKEVPRLEVADGNEILEVIAGAGERCEPDLTLESWRLLRKKLENWGDENTMSSLISLGRIFNDTEAYAEARNLFRNRELPVEDRVEALKQMLLADSSRGLDEFLQAWREPHLRLSIIPLLSEVSIGFHYFVREWHELPPAEKDALVKEMLRSERGASELLMFVRSDVMSPEVLNGGNLALLETVSPELAASFREDYGGDNADKLWQRCSQLVLDGEGSAEVGQEVYQRLCSSCHRFKGGKGDLGPDLSGYDFRDAESLLKNIIFPSASVAPDARLMVVTMRDGTVVTGTSLGETINGDVRMKTALGESVVTNHRLRSVEVFEKSLMPEGLLEGLSDEEVKGLMKYLQGGSE